MEQPIKIVDPEIRILKSEPSSLGNIDCYMVIFDKDVFSVEKYGDIESWFQENGSCITYNVRDDDFEYSIYVMHSEKIAEGDPVIPLLEEDLSSKKFVTNIISYDSCLMSHCLGICEEDNILYIKSGFHYWSACDQKGYTGPTSYDSMSKIYDGDYRFLAMDRSRFWHLYHPMLKIWTEQVTTERIAKINKRFNRGN
jgi:hypothetical protein